MIPKIERTHKLDHFKPISPPDTLICRALESIGFIVSRDFLKRPNSTTRRLNTLPRCIVPMRNQGGSR